MAKKELNVEQTVAKVKALLKKYGVTQLEFALITGLSKGYVNQVLKGNKIPSKKTIRTMLEEANGCKPEA